MRKQILTITLMLGSLFPTSLHAQHAYRPLVVDGKDWVSGYLRETDIIHMENGKIVDSERTEDYGEMHEVLEGDTVINGLTYKKVQTTTPYKSYCYYALREEDRKVYAYVFNPKQEFLLYDFNVEVGDVVMAGMQGDRSKKCTIVEKREVELQGEPFYFYAVEVTEHVNSSYRSYWVESIGSPLGIQFEPDYAPIPQSNRDEIEDPETYTGPFITTWDSYLFDYCMEGGKLLGTREEIWALFTGIQSTEASKSVPSDYIYDLSGRRVQGTPKKGVYIQNGKKVVIK